MSYLVTKLLAERLRIKEITDVEEDGLLSHLLSLETAISCLQSKGVITETDVRILYTFGEYPTWQAIAKVLKLERTAVTRRFYELTNILGQFLGGDFNDSILLENLKENKSLSDGDVKKLQERIKKETHAKQI